MAPSNPPNKDVCQRAGAVGLIAFKKQLRLAKELGIHPSFAKDLRETRFALALKFARAHNDQELGAPIAKGRKGHPLMVVVGSAAGRFLQKSDEPILRCTYAAVHVACSAPEAG
ncbi:hypothetical protein [Pseudoduganella guangdongensis]|uniref:hypothetical protein n=1 Tax=Pseudoduganella guangdongensis TaxID=2692179 RepID=UPI001E35562F|nr:hypothetical protein [Pseudoduganella guangdongensis]